MEKNAFGQKITATEEERERGVKESETLRVHLVDAEGQTEFRFKSHADFPKVNNPSVCCDAATGNLWMPNCSRT